MSKHVVVIGGGLGGLSAAIRLAQRGFNVQLFEQNSHLGGKMNRFTAENYYFDTGPSLLTMPFVVDELFSAAGVIRSDVLEFIPIDPICRYFWDDGRILDSSGDPIKMKAEINKFSAEDATRFDDFIEYAKRIYDLTADIFLFNSIHEMRSLLTRRHFSRLLRIHQIDPLRTLHQGISRFFKHPRIVQLFDRYATYNGSDPFHAPATLNIIPYVEFGLGSYYIKGGMYRLVSTLEDIARTSGVAIYTSTPVDQILQQQRRVQGVIVAKEKIAADVVVCNADVVVAHHTLIDGFPGKRQRLNQLEPSLSGMVFLWGVSKRQQQLAQHNIFFSNNYHLEFEQIFRHHRLPDDPTIYIAITSKTDAEHAPGHGENWFVLVNVPYLTDERDWHNEAMKLKKIILNKLRQFGIDIENQIVTEKIYTPLDFYQLYSSNRGSIYGISSNQRSTAFRRPANRSREINGLYFAGGSTHPGGGVPLVLLSGKICADLICART